MSLRMKILGLLAMVIASTTAAVAAPANSTRIPGAAAADEFKIAAAGQVCCEVGEEDDWSPTAQACTAQQGKVVANSVCTAPDEADDGGPDDGVEDDDGGPDDGVDDGGPDDGGPDDGKDD
jgi:hypothetical protein